ncbi:MAG: heme-copper oxidase subunit III [Dehalococcoidia bacterium]
MAHAQQPELVETTGIPSPKLGMWLFLSGEIVLFGGVIMSIVMFRLSFSGWAEESTHTNTIIGTWNTFNLLTSSMLVAIAYKMSRLGRRGMAMACLGGTLAFALLFTILKAIEWSIEIHEGFTIFAGPFWQFYYGATGLHALHVLVGVVLFSVILVLYGGRWRPNYTVENAALYWHFVDIVWLFLWPLFYLS